MSHRKSKSTSRPKNQTSPVAQGQTHQMSPSSTENAPASSYIPRRNAHDYPMTLRMPDLNAMSVAAIQREFPEIFKDASIEDAASFRPPAPTEALRMLDGVKDSEIPWTCEGRPPSQIQVQCSESTKGSICPTHIIACPNGKVYSFFPVHSSILMMNCASLPTPFPPVAVPSGSRTTLEQPILPVVVYRLPSADAFLAMQKWMYLKDDVLLLEMCLPSNRSLWATSLDGANRQLAFLFGMWCNACYLGVIDRRIYTVIQIGWSEVYAIRSRFQHPIIAY